MIEQAFQQLRSFTGDPRFGVLHALGADPKMIHGNTGVFNFFGKEIAYDANDITPSISKDLDMSMHGKAFGFIAPTFLAWQVGGTFYQQGFGAAVNQLSQEVGINAAITRYGYRTAHDGKTGLKTLKPGNPTGMIGSLATVLERKGGSLGRLTAGGIGYADMFHRYAWGSVLGSATAGIGGPVGMGLGYVGGAMGVRYAGALSTVGLLGLAGTQVVRGGAAVLNYARDTRLNRKVINTDGDMSAFMTSGAFTQREAAVQAIHKSHMNARSALGQEATYLSNPQRSYFSPYRQF